MRKAIEFLKRVITILFWRQVAVYIFRLKLIRGMLLVSVGTLLSLVHPVFAVVILWGFFLFFIALRDKWRDMKCKISGMDPAFARGDWDAIGEHEGPEETKEHKAAGKVESAMQFIETASGV